MTASIRCGIPEINKEALVMWEVSERLKMLALYLTRAMYS